MNATLWNELKILVVEGCPIQARLLEEILTEKGAEVTTALSGKEGLETTRKLHPDIIISDIEVPEMSGYELCQHVKTDDRTKNISIILFAPLSNPADVIKGIECGADNFITKPCKNALLFSCIENLSSNLSKPKIVPNHQTLDVCFDGKQHRLRVSHQQITELLLSTYASAIEKNKELKDSNRKLSELHLELQKQTEELAKASEEKNKLLGMAAHDLRNPLYAIQEYSKMLHNKFSEKLDAKSLKILSRIHSSANLMGHIINDMLDISVLESGKFKLNLCKQNLLSLLKESLELNERIAENNKIKLVVKHDQQIPDILCDPSKIEQLLNNLIGNAIKFSSPDTEVEISLTCNHQDIILQIKDHGIGIPKKDQEKIFRTFMRVNSKNKTNVEGTGLGLAIVKKIVEAHGGRITVDSKEGAGSTFTVFLPKKN